MGIQSISVIGLGEMGTPIAGFLLKAGYRVKGYDTREKQLTALVPQGLSAAKSPRDAAAGVDMILLSLPNWHIVEEVVEGKDGILEGAQEGQIIIDCSTVPPHKTKGMAEKLGTRRNSALSPNSIHVAAAGTAPTLVNNKGLPETECPRREGRAIAEGWRRVKRRESN